MYPNPSTDYITLRSKEEIKKVSVSSLEGKVILNAENSKNIDISKLPKGVYILKGEFRNGASFSKKIIKK